MSIFIFLLLFLFFYFLKSCPLWDNVKKKKKYCWSGQVTDENIMWHVHCMFDTYGYKCTLRICNTYCFSTATLVARTYINVTLYIHCLSSIVYVCFPDWIISCCVAHIQWEYIMACVRPFGIYYGLCETLWNHSFPEYPNCAFENIWLYNKIFSSLSSSSSWWWWIYWSLACRSFDSSYTCNHFIQLLYSLMMGH